MISPTSTVTINRPVGEVFDFVARGYVENHPKWDDGCVSSNKNADAPLAVGSTGVEVRNDGGREATYDFTITALEEGNRLMALEAESKEALFWMSYTFEDQGRRDRRHRRAPHEDEGPRTPLRAADRRQLSQAARRESGGDEAPRRVRGVGPYMLAKKPW